MQADDLELDRQPRRPAGRLRVVVSILIVIALLATAIVIQRQVETDAALHRGPWQFDVDYLPAWLPPGFGGELTELKALPHRIALRNSTWNDDLRAAIEANPWIRRVERLEKSGRSVRFQAIFERPVVALWGEDQFFLLDSAGTVIDVQSGDELAPEWGMSYFRPAQPIGPVRSGDRVVRRDVAELLSLVAVLWQSGVYERWADRIPELACQPITDGSLVWSLLLANGVELRWGRAPGSERVSALSDVQKVTNLAKVMERWGSLQPARLIVLNEENRPIRR